MFSGINDKKKIIIKIGTKAIFDFSKNKIKQKIIKGLAKNISVLLKNNYKVILVSSGAVGCGKELIKKGDELGLKQAQAAVGQIKLMEIYIKQFSKQKIHVAQFLINSEDLKDSIRLRNIKRAYENLNPQIIPIINENDVTNTEELSFGDNDQLAVEVLLKFDFDILLALTEKGALIKEGKKISRTVNFTAGIYDDFSKEARGFGGLKSKLKAAKKAVDGGKDFIIAKAGDNIIKILNGEILATRFYKRG